MKKVSFIPFLMVLLSFVALSCNNEDDVILENPKDMYSSEIDLNNMSVVLNGQQHDIENLKFYPSNDDSTKLLMRIEGIIPSDSDLVIPVNVIPTQDSITFSGKNSDSRYDFEVRGIYKKRSSIVYGTHNHVRLECSYKVIDGLKLEHPYVFRFDKGCIDFSSEDAGSFVDDKGNTYNNAEVAKTAITDICKNISRETTAMQFLFHENGTMDISLQKGGDTEMKPWMTVPYWFSKSSNAIILVFNDEQQLQVCYQWTGLPNICVPFLVNYGFRTSGYPLKLIYTDEDKFSFSFDPIIGYRIYSMYARAKGLEGTTAGEQQSISLFKDILSKSNNYESWQFIFTSE